MACPGHVDGAFVGRHEATGTLEDVAVPHRAVADRGLALRRASRTGRLPGLPAASASSVETPATGIPRERASVLAVTSPIRSPV